MLTIRVVIIPRWIDTSTMIADPLTKSMNSDRRTQTLATGQLDLRPTAESLIIKEKNRELRKAKTTTSSTEPGAADSE